MIRVFLKTWTAVGVAVLIGVWTAQSRAATDFANSDALRGMNSVKVYFDVSQKDGDLLALRMELLDKTLTQLHEAGLEVHGVIGFRGGASRFITRNDDYVLEEEVANKRKIQDWIKRFADRGVVVEQCIIAAELFDILPNDFLPDVTIVGNGYISLIGYQAQGYSVVPMD